MWTYLSLFAAAFAAATILPMQSEALLAYHAVQGHLSVPVLFAVATLGNVLGSVANWMCGRFLRRFQDRPWFPASPAAMQRAEARYHRFGRWSLLASWVPIVGDPLTVMAGMMREPLLSFVLIVTIAKAGRYLVVLGVALAWL